jgi:hypothetical protein
MRIWYQSTLDFAQHPHYASALAAHFRKIASPGTQVLLHGRNQGGAASLTAADIINSPIVYHSIVDPASVRAVLDAGTASADAFILPRRELSPKVGDGGNRKGGISWGVLEASKLIQPGNVEDLGRVETVSKASVPEARR